jgi:hypothetical protein
MNIPLWILTGAYALHIVEEYRGGWLDWAQKLSGLHMRKSEFIVANSLVIILGSACAIIGYAHPLVSLTFAGLAIVNALTAHIGTTIAKRVWSPGLITSIVLFIPLGIWAYYDSYAKGLIDAGEILITLIAGFLIMCVPIAYQLAKSRIMQRSLSLPRGEKGKDS